MTDNRIELTRRKILASMGAVGAAGAGAGLGTSALFSDQESFANNEIVAGQLDLKVDWQQTYSGPIPGSGGAVGDHPVNAYPDTPMEGESYGDGLQDLGGVPYSGAGEIDPVFDAADVPACCDCAEDEYYVTYGGETYCIEPLSGSDPEDAYDKVGVKSENTEFQEDSRSTVFLWEDDEDGNVYLFVVNDRVETDAGGTATYEIEGAPEARWVSSDWQVQDDEPSSDDSYEDPDSSDQIAVGNWIWQGPNTDGGVLGPVNNNGSQGDFALRLTPRLNELAETYDPPWTDYGWFDESDYSPLTALTVLDGAADNPITLESDIPSSGEGVDQITIHSACGIDSGAGLDTPAVFRSANYPDQQHLVELGDVKPGDRGEITFSLHLCDNPGYLWLAAANYEQRGGTTTEPERAELGEGEADDGELAEHTMVRIWYDEDCDNVYDDDGDEQLVFGPGIGGYTDFDGDNPATLAAAMDVILDGEGSGRIPLDGQAPRMGWDAGATADNRNCLPAESGMCVGVEWWVPTQVGNEVQGDVVEFDLGFYTEQCRNNDGSGQEGEPT